MFTSLLVTISMPPGQEVPRVHRLLLRVLGVYQALAASADMHAPAAVSPTSAGSLGVQRPAQYSVPGVLHGAALLLSSCTTAGLPYKDLIGRKTALHVCQGSPPASRGTCSHTLCLSHERGAAVAGVVMPQECCCPCRVSWSLDWSCPRTWKRWLQQSQGCFAMQIFK